VHGGQHRVFTRQGTGDLAISTIVGTLSPPPIVWRRLTAQRVPSRLMVTRAVHVRDGDRRRVLGTLSTP